MLSGVVLNCAVFGGLFRPLTASTRQIAPAEQSDTCSYFLVYYMIESNFHICIYSIRIFISDQREHIYEVESLPNSQRNGHGPGHLKRKPRTTSVRVPSVNVISEVMDGPMIRSQSVGHNMAVETTHSHDSNKLLNTNYNCNGSQEKGTKTMQHNGKSDGMRYTLSQPLLINTTSEHENKPLKESHKHWRSGTLSRPDIFYQVR